MSVRMSFDDCPYNCSDGRIFNYELKKYEHCPHCSSKRSELADNGLAETEDGDVGALPTVLGINSKYLKPNFVYDAVIPEGERIFLDEESLKRQKEVLDDIYLGLTVGELPDRSVCIGLGNKGQVDSLAYPLLAKAYLNGLSVAKFTSCNQFNRLKLAMSEEVYQYYDKDFVIMMIPDGASKADILSAKGLMQDRALEGKPTVFVTTWVIEACSILLGYYDSESNFLARGVFVEYIKGNKKSKYINQLTGVTNEIYTDSENIEKAPQKGTNMTTMAGLLE